MSEMFKEIPIRSVKEIEKLDNRTKVFIDIDNERNRQKRLWGEQVHPYPVWLTILAEEFGEVAQAIQAGYLWSKESDSNDLYKELVQVAAVSTAIAEQVIRDEEKKKV